MLHSLALERAAREFKRFAGLQAEFARRGFALDPLSGSKVIVQRWGLSRVLADLDEAERFLATVGGSN